MYKRSIAVVTGSRADYGLLYWLLREIKHDPDLNLRIIVTGMHLSSEFGNTYREIEKDGFDIAYKVDSLISSDSSVAITKSVGLGVIGFADAYKTCSPDIIVFLGDRHEIIAAGLAALMMRIPVAHIHGGEITSAMLDDPIRHCLTKIAHLHFPAAIEYAENLYQLGEDPKSVYCLGSPGLDNLSRLNLMSKEALEKDLNIDLKGTIFLITYHPVTLQPGRLLEHYQQLFAALSAFPDVTLIFTCSNSDHEGRQVFDILKRFQALCDDRKVYVYTTLGFKRYVSLTKFASLVLGNSSSGLIEIPHIGIPTVNIGDRQKSRLRASSVIDCSNDKDSIVSAIDRALSPKFQAGLCNVVSPYIMDDASVKIKNILKSCSLDNILEKKFHHVRSVDEEEQVNV